MPLGAASAWLWTLKPFSTGSSSGSPPTPRSPTPTSLACSRWPAAWPRLAHRPAARRHLPRGSDAGPRPGRTRRSPSRAASRWAASRSPPLPLASRLRP